MIRSVRTIAPGHDLGEGSLLPAAIAAMTPTAGTATAQPEDLHVRRV